MNDQTPNPFGFVDHSAFAGFGVDLVWGLDVEGAPVHINAARRGLACRLICPACKAPLIARKGAKKAAHFSHQGKNSGCGSGRETNAHYWAKQLLVEKRQIWTPVVTAVVDGVSRPESKAKWMTFSDVRSERRLDRIVPDIVLILEDGRELIVEICVTHPCGEDKIALIQSNSWPAVEINLRLLRTCQDIAVIERALLETAPRRWLCNPRRDRAEDKLRAELAAAAASRAEAARRKAAQEADRQRREALAVEADGRKLLAAAASARAAVRPISDPGLLQLIARDEGELFGISGDGEGFAVTPDEWQATVVEQFVSIGDIRSYEDETFSLERVLVYLKPFIAPAFVQPPTDKVRAWMRVHHRAFRFPHEALEDYLDALCVTGSLQSDEPGQYRLSDDVVTRIEREQRRLIEIDHRAEVAHAIVDQIIADLPPEEAFLVEPQAWLDTVLPGNSASPTQIITAGGAPYHDLIAGLGALAKMVAGGEDAVDDVLELPLAAARYRAVERLSARRSREATQRSQRIRDVAAQSLGQDAGEWLTTPIEDTGETPLALSRAGQAGLDLCLNTIAAIGRHREAERVAVAATATRRDKLQAVVTKLFAPNLRELALKNQSPQLGSSPWEACTTDHGLDSAIRVLTIQSQGRSRRW